jgi:hypothetical protein
VKWNDRLDRIEVQAEHEHEQRIDRAMLQLLRNDPGRCAWLLEAVNEAERNPVDSAPVLIGAIPEGDEELKNLISSVLLTNAWAREWIRGILTLERRMRA